MVLQLRRSAVSLGHRHGVRSERRLHGIRFSAQDNLRWSQSGVVLAAAAAVGMCMTVASARRL